MQAFVSLFRLQRCELVSKSPNSVDEYLFREGMTLANYWIERTPVSEVVCYKNLEGREFDLMISNNHCTHLIKQRLLALGVRIVEAGRAGIARGEPKP